MDPLPLANLPCGHGAQELDSLSAAKDPGPHCTHPADPSLAANSPGPHTSHEEDAFNLANLPLGQGWHALTPSAENQPAGHGTQSPAAGSGQLPGAHWRPPDDGAKNSKDRPVLSMLTPLKARLTSTMPSWAGGGWQTTAVAELAAAGAGRASPNWHLTVTAAPGSTGKDLPTTVTRLAAVVFEGPDAGTSRSKTAPP